MKDIYESAMIKVMSFYSGVRARHVYGWVSIIWFISAVRIAVSEDVPLQTVSEVVAQCGENVTLPCGVTMQSQLDIKLFSWVRGNKLCTYEDSQLDPEVLCESTEDTPNHRLSMTLLNVMPVDQGEYFCKLRSKVGVGFAKTLVTVQDCFENSKSYIQKTHATCQFRGVYPSGTVHWFQGDVNLTDSAITQEEEDQYGRYDVMSTIDVQKGKSEPYRCSLWIPSVGKNLHAQELPMVKALESSGSMVRVQWICIMVEIMVVKFMK
ncbi:uncharacterized protein LOC127356900 [Dicentrarchus labrax]|uniref:uncharacterized protein LOC127356900 n=1 Tax=Dicentrarchus labrax TaxID=13489 RepID=UPI0021F652A2|nr:uncharacterized protein LOC127356900 [Dicentrarchus labrax]